MRVSSRLFSVQLCCLLCFSFVLVCQSTHLKGTWRTTNFFKFLSKFGFQKTDLHYEKETVGYIFGNITSRSNFGNYITLAVLNRQYFLEYYGNRSLLDKEEACANMFNRIKSVAYDPSCYPDGYDFLRNVPCPKGGICVNEDSPQNLVKKTQFTYHIRDLSEPRHVYLFLTCLLYNVNK